SPKKTLEAGEKHTLEIRNLKALYSDAELDEEEFSFTPESSDPRTILVQDTVEARDKDNLDPLLPNPCAIQEGVEDPIKSVLTDQAINCVPMESVLLGDKDSTMQYGDVFAELAYLPNFVEVSPLRVPRGSLLAGTN